MKANIIKRVLSGALALSLVLAPSVGAMASSSSANVGGNQGGAAATTAVQTVKYETSSSVAGVRSTVGGVFILKRDVKGAVTLGSGEIARLFGLGAGERPFVKMIDMDNKKSHLAYKCMTDTARALGAEIFGTMNVELGKMAAGRFSLLFGEGRINVVFNVPAKFQGRNVAVICVQEGGKVAVLADTDTVAGTLNVALPAGASALAFIAY